jgi:predicted DNA-binding protein with PD1-like motif
MGKAVELRTGRTLGVTFDHGEDFFTALDQVCRTNGVRQGYIPAFIGAFLDADLVGTCDRLDDPIAPVWSKVHVTTAEALGAGTIAYDPAEDRIVPHIHVAVGLKQHSATGHTSHLLAGTVQFITEMLIVEVLEPVMRRPADPGLYDVPLLTFGAS